MKKKTLIESKSESPQNKEKYIKLLDDKISQSIKRQQKANIDREFSKIKNTIKNKGRVSAMFNLREQKLGSKIKSQDPAAIKCPKSNNIIHDPKEIRKHTLQYCVNLLENKLPNKDYEELFQLKKEVHEMRMGEPDSEKFTLTEDMFNKALKDIVKKNNDKYNFIVNAGEDLKKAVFNLMKFVWEYKIKPEQWRVDTLHQIHKKGSKMNLDNYRFNHTKSDLSKCFGLLVTKTVK